MRDLEACEKVSEIETLQCGLSSDRCQVEDFGNLLLYSDYI